MQRRRSARWRRSFGDDGKRRWRKEVPSSLRYAAVREVDGGGLLFAVVEVSERKAVFAMPWDHASSVENRHSGVVIGRHLTGAAVF